jgi:hypothetical protein
VRYSPDSFSGCNGSFESRKAGIQVLFGLDPYSSTRPFLTIRTDLFIGTPPTA